MTGLASAERRPKLVPDRPRWWPLVWGTIVGYLRAYLYLLLFWIVSSAALGIDLRSDDVGAGWPFVADGVWSVVAGAAFAIPIIAVASLCIAGSVAKRIGSRVSASWTFAGLLVSFYALPLLGDWQSSAAGLVLATAVLVRFAAVDHDPLWKLILHALPLRLRLPLVVGLAGLLAGCFVAGASYAFTHPLARAGSGGSSHSGSTAQYAFGIRNGSLAGLTVLDVQLRGDDASRFAVAGFSKGFDRSQPVRLRGASIPRYSERILLLALRQRCPSSGRVSLPERVRITYRLLGRTFRQLVPLDAADEFC